MNTEFTLLKLTSSHFRKLLSMSALLLSHQDSVQGQSLVTSGQKVELAKAVGRVMAEAGLAARDLQVELAMLQPSWLSAAVSRHLLSSQHSVDTPRGVSGIISSLASLDLGASEAGLVMENYCHKMMAHQHAHTIFRANWHFVKNKEREFCVFRMMNKLEDRGISLNSKMIRLEEVTVKQRSIIDCVNMIQKFSNKTKNDDTLAKEGPIAALLFRMKSAEDF